MNTLTFAVVVFVELCAVAGQILFKKAMNQSGPNARRKMVWNLAAGVAVMALNFFLWLGLLARFDLSYLFPFEGLNRLVLVAAAIFILKEKLTWDLAIGVVLISVGVCFVAAS